MIKNLVISGGGVKIVGALGAVKYLDEIKQLGSIEKYFGTSAGSVLCLMLVLGYSADEMVKFIENFDLNKIFIVNTDDLFTTWNVCSNSKLEKVLKLFINFKLGKPCLSGLGFGLESTTASTSTTAMCSLQTNYENITMEELYKHTGKTLSVTSVCLEKRAPVYITHETFPKMPVWKAVLASCSIPLIFKPIEWDGFHYVDGALVDNFPLFGIFHQDIPHTLGIQTTVDMEQSGPPMDTPEFNLYHYIVNIIKIVMESKTQIKSHNVISVKIDSSILNDFLDVNLSVQTKNAIIAQGYTQAKSQFKNLFFGPKTDPTLKIVKPRSKSF
jgi:predicted acylesterase/phospholipase RssA